jgi:hypothetical protein
MTQIVANFIWSYGGLTVLVGLAAVAWASFLPFLKREAIIVAVAAFALTFLQAKAYDNGLTVKQAEWDRAKQATVKEVDAAVDGGARDVRDGVRDPYDRDDN